MTSSDDDDIQITGKRRDKLIETKQEWARDGRLLTGQVADPARDRLPPGQTLVKDWPVLDLGIQPIIVDTGHEILDLLNEVSLALVYGGLSWVDRAKAKSVRLATPPSPRTESHRLMASVDELE